MNLQLLRHYAHMRGVPILSLQTEIFLDVFLDQHKPLYCLEIGSAIGYSTLFLIKKIVHRHGYLFSFELSLPSYKECLYHTSLLLSPKEKAYLTIFPFDITNVSLHQLLFHPLDFVFVDGRKAQYLTYLKLLEPFLNPGAILIFDDCIKFASRMQDFFCYLQHLQALSRQYHVISLDVDDGIVMLMKP